MAFSLMLSTVSVTLLVLSLSPFVSVILIIKSELTTDPLKKGVGFRLRFYLIHPVHSRCLLGIWFYLMIIQR